ncbi:hypothetical protein ACQY0O_001516 [Thecaphora frezii]
MSTLVQKLSRFLRLGKSRYIVGYDLAGNAYLELPSRHASPDPRHTRRIIQWRENLHHADYDQRSLPVQWTMWLRHTRRHPPTIQELEQDQARIQTVQHNARVLAMRQAEQSNTLQHQTSQGYLEGSQEPHSAQHHLQQPRTPDDDVWAASRARLAQRGQAPAPGSSSSSTPVQDALQRRQAKREQLQRQDEQRLHAQREMAKSPLEAFVPAPRPRR